MLILSRNLTELEPSTRAQPIGLASATRTVYMICMLELC